MQSLKKIPTERLELLLKQKKNNFRYNTDNGFVTLDETSEFKLYGKLLRDAYHHANNNPFDTLGDLLEQLIKKELLTRKTNV